MRQPTPPGSGRTSHCMCCVIALTTHLLERGTDIRIIQAGHAKLDATAPYTRVATGMTASIESPLDLLKQSRKRPRRAARPRCRRNRRRPCPVRRWRLRVSSTTTGRIVAGSAGRAAKLGQQNCPGVRFCGDQYRLVAISIVAWYVHPYAGCPPDQTGGQPPYCAFRRLQHQSSSSMIQ
jgi:hypothetical protein